VHFGKSETSVSGTRIPDREKFVIAPEGLGFSEALHSLHPDSLASTLMPDSVRVVPSPLASKIMNLGTFHYPKPAIGTDRAKL